MQHYCWIFSVLVYFHQHLKTHSTNPPSEYVDKGPYCTCCHFYNIYFRNWTIGCDRVVIVTVLPIGCCSQLLSCKDCNRQDWSMLSNYACPPHWSQRWRTHHCAFPHYHTWQDLEYFGHNRNSVHLQSSFCWFLRLCSSFKLKKSVIKMISINCHKNISFLPSWQVHLFWGPFWQRQVNLMSAKIALCTSFFQSL